MLQIVRIIIALGLVSLLFYKIDVKQFFSAISNISPLNLISSFTLIFLGIYINSIRIWLYMHRYLNHKITFLNGLKIYLTSTLLNYTFLGGVGGEIYKIYYLSKQSIAKAKSIKMILTEKINVLFTLFILIVLNSFVLLPGYIVNYFILIPIPLYVLYRIYLLLDEKIFLVPKPLSRTNLGIYLIVQIIFIFSIIIIALSIKPNVDYISLAQLSLIFLISNIVSFLPISIGGIGLREWTFFYGAKVFKTNVAFAVTVCIVFFIGSMLTSLTGIVPLIRPKTK
jgi:uncharacterized membrane protein YbhN (UPF0104 family)